MIVTREQGQRMVVDEYKKHGFIFVKYATGFGKGKAALDAVSSKLSFLPWRGLIITHSENGRDITWPEQLNEWAPDLDRDRILIKCWQGLDNIRHQKFDWVIADECHYITLRNSKFFNSNNIKSLILMSATEPEDSDKKQIINRLCKGHKLEIKLDLAIRSGVLNDYRIRVWYVTMTSEEKRGYIEVCKRFERAKSTGNIFAIQNAMGARARYIYELETKIKAGLYLRDQIRNTGKRFVIFCGSVESANKLSPYRYHSKADDTHYKQFLAGDIDEIVSIKRIQEGSNIWNLQSALVVQIKSKELNIIQQLGRLLRLAEGEIAKMHILIVKDTFDQTWMYKALKNLDQTKIKYLDLDRDLYDHY